MNEQVRNILEQSTTKTSKIEQLLRLGLTRREIADLVTRGNYGFVYNVEKKMLEREGGVLQNRIVSVLMDIPSPTSSALRLKPITVIWKDWHAN